MILERAPFDKPSLCEMGELIFKSTAADTSRKRFNFDRPGYVLLALGEYEEAVIHMERVGVLLCYYQYQTSRLRHIVVHSPLQAVDLGAYADELWNRLGQGRHGKKDLINHRFSCINNSIWCAQHFHFEKHASPLERLARQQPRRRLWSGACSN
jgi:hypothetical protein